MNWNPNKQEIEAILSLKAKERYAYSIKKITDREIIWSLWHENGWALCEDATNHILVPVWPHADYAALAAKDEWTGYKPKPITLDEFLTRWVPGMAKDKRLVAVFPTPDDKGVVIDPIRLGENIQEEERWYEKRS